MTYHGTLELRLGVAGLGLAGKNVLELVRDMANIQLVAAADTDPQALSWFRETYPAKHYEIADALIDDPDVDVVWIATPTPLHAQHSIAAARKGKHVIVEKPMALTLHEAEEMISAARENGVALVCGGSRSSSPVIVKMREILRGGELGDLRAISSWASTDWMLRPRRADELDEARGGGVVARQAPHQVDTARLLAGGLTRSVRAVTGRWGPRQTAPGYYTAQLQFHGGLPATLLYSGYGYFMASELFNPVLSGPNTPGLADRIQAREQSYRDSRDDVAAKRQRSSAGRGLDSRFLADVGLLVVSCERGELRQSPMGVYVYGDSGIQEVTLNSEAVGLAELHELSSALADGQPIVHSGEWGLATLEVCLAITKSCVENREIELSHQTAVPPGF